MLEKAVHLIGEKMRSMLFGDRYESIQLLDRELTPGGIMREVRDDDARVRLHGRFDSVEIERPVARVERNQRYRRAGRSRDFMQRLIARPHDHRVVAGS